MLEFFQLLGGLFSSEGIRGGMFVALVVLTVPVVVLLYVLLIRPQLKWRTEWRRQQEALEDMRKGDVIVTREGVYATVVYLKNAGEIVVAELTNRESLGVRVEVMRSAITDVIRKADNEDTDEKNADEAYSQTPEKNSHHKMSSSTSNYKKSKRYKKSLKGDLAHFPLGKERI